MYNMLQKWGRNGYRKCTRTRSKNKVTVLIDSKQLINDNFVGQTVKLKCSCLKSAKYMTLSE